MLAITSRLPPGWRGSSNRGRPGYQSSDKVNFSDFFEEVFRNQGFSGGGFRGQGSTEPPKAERGADQQAVVRVDIEDAYTGASRQVTVKSQAGLNREEQTRTLKVSIPKGVKQGQKIRLTGQGSSGQGGGAAGDLFLEVVFNNHSVYRVEERDVSMDLLVAPWELALGAVVKVKTPEGLFDLKIPEGTASGSRMRLKGKGIPGQPNGDFYVVLKVVLPPADTENAKDFYRRMARELAFNPRPESGW